MLRWLRVETAFEDPPSSLSFFLSKEFFFKREKSDLLFQFLLNNPSYNAGFDVSDSRNCDLS